MKLLSTLFIAVVILGANQEAAFAQYSGSGSSGTTTTGPAIPTSDTKPLTGPLQITTSAKNPDLSNPALWDRLSQVCTRVEVEPAPPADACDPADFYFIGFENYSSIPVPLIGFDCRVYLMTPSSMESCLDQLRDPLESIRYISFGWAF